MKLNKQTGIEVNPLSTQVKKLTWRAAFVIGIGAVYGVANATSIVNGGFEQMPRWNIAPGGANWRVFSIIDIPGWRIEDGLAATIHLDGDPTNFPVIHDEYSLNTDGQGFGGENTNIWQDFATVAGAEYTLTYQWRSWLQSSNVLNVLIHEPNNINNQLVTSIHTWTNIGGQIQNVSQTFTGTGSPLRLRILQNPGFGTNDNSFIVDNFAVTSPVPEPATMLAVGGGVAALLRRRRKK